MIKELQSYLRFTWGLREFLQNPITLEYSKQLIKERLRKRTDNLLKLVKVAIYENPDSPYLKLLKLAGCEYGDFEKMVLQEGIESALTLLRKKDVYISIDEFKGKKSTIRGSSELFFNEQEFDNPHTVKHLERATGGTHGRGARIYYDLNFIKENRSVYAVCQLTGFGSPGIPFVRYGHVMPGIGMLHLLQYAKANMIVNKWFAPLRSKQFKPGLKNKVANNFIIFTSSFWGTRLPFPEYVTFDEVWRIAAYIDRAISDYGSCYLGTSPSDALAICVAARERGYNIAGTRCIVGGEPLTIAKLREMEASGLKVTTQYAFTEGGYAGLGCLSPVYADEVHLLKDSLATIEYSVTMPHVNLPVNTLLFTSLLFSSPKILFNVENGDHGIIEKRSCGCIFDELGLTEHLHDIRSFEKFTSHAMTLFATDLRTLIDEILPREFGGTPIDYQIVEEEDKTGKTFITIVVKPEIGPIDESLLIDTVLNEIRKGNDGYKLASATWLKSDTIRIKRAQPQWTKGGKLLPLNIRTIE